MIFRRTECFLKAFRSLPADTQRKILKALALFGQDQRHPSLQVNKLQGRDGVWEARLDQKCRFTIHYEKGASGESICVLRYVDNHDECLQNPKTSCRWKTESGAGATGLDTSSPQGDMLKGAPVFDPKWRELILRSGEAQAQNAKYKDLTLRKERKQDDQ